MPEGERKLREELEKDKSFLQVTCTLEFMVDKDPKYLQARSKDNRTRLSLYQTFHLGKGVVNAKQFCPTHEGDKVVHYLIVEQGNAKLIEDYSRDRFSSMRVYSHVCKNLVLGSYEQINGEPEIVFQAIANKDVNEAKDKVTFSLQCEFESESNYRKFGRF